MKQFFRTLGLFPKATALLFSRKFRFFLLFPLLFIILMFWMGSTAVTFVWEATSAWLSPIFLGWCASVPWLGNVLQWSGIVGEIVMKIGSFFLMVFFGGYIMLIVLSPVFAWLSERTEAHLNGTDYPFQFGQFCKDILRGILISIRNSVMQLLMSLACLLIMLIPVVGVAVPILFFLISAYFYGFTFLDYVAERKKLSIKQSVMYMRQNKGIVLAIGAVFTLALMFPWVNLIVCSFLSLVCVIVSVLALEAK